MASTQAIQVFESVYRRTDQQIRDILATYELPAEVDTINTILGDGVNAMTPGIGAAIRVDFRARITGCFLQEFDGNTGSVSIDIQRAQGGASPSFVSITPVANPAIVSGRYFADESVDGWTTELERGDYLRYVVTTVATITRVHVGLRARRLEP